MPHDLLHAHPFYDDRPLLNDGRLSLPYRHQLGPVEQAQPTPPKSKKPALIPKTKRPRDNRVIWSLLFVIPQPRCCNSPSTICARSSKRGWLEIRRLFIITPLVNYNLVPISTLITCFGALCAFCGFVDNSGRVLRRIRGPGGRERFNLAYLAPLNEHYKHPRRYKASFGLNYNSLLRRTL